MGNSQSPLDSTSFTVSKDQLFWSRVKFIHDAVVLIIVCWSVKGVFPFMLEFRTFYDLNQVKDFVSENVYSVFNNRSIRISPYLFQTLNAVVALEKGPFYKLCFEFSFMFSFLCFIVILYRLRYIDYLAKYLTRLELQRLSNLPVSIDDLVINFEKEEILLKGLCIKHPHPVMDSRWETSYMVSIDLMQFKLFRHPTYGVWLPILLHILSLAELLIFRSMVVKGLKINVEGYRAKENCSDVDYNFMLLGKGVKYRDIMPFSLYKIPISVDREASTSTSKNIGHHRSPCKTSPVGHGTSVEMSSHMTCTLSKKSLVQSEPSSPLQKAVYAFQNVSSITFSVTKTVTNLITETIEEMTNDALEFTQRVNEVGIMSASKITLSESTSRLQRSIYDGIEDKLNDLHIKIRGKEPKPKEELGQSRFVVEKIAIDSVQINLVRVLPVHLHYLEKESLLTSNFEIVNQGFEGLKWTKNIVEECSNSEYSKLHSFRNVNTDTSPVAEVFPATQLRFSPQSQRHIDNVTNDGNDCETKLSLDHLDFSSIDIYNSGVDLNIVKYRLERALLHEVYKSNAGRLLYEAIYYSVFDRSNKFGSQDVHETEPIFNLLDDY